MAHLQQVDGGKQPPREEACLDGRLRVAGEERGEGAVPEEQDERPVVDVAVGQRSGRILGGRVEDLEGRHR
jgi:hypothetical protein